MAPGSFRVMSYGKINLRDVEDVAVKQGLADNQEARLLAEIWELSRLV